MWDDALVVTDTMNLYYIKAQNSWRLKVAEFSRDESFKVEDILRAIVTDGNDADSDLSLICTEGNIGNDV